MASDHERQVVINHALLSEENLGIALLIGSAYEDLCGRVVLAFLEAVQQDLTRRLQERWKVVIKCNPGDYLDRWPDFLVAEYLGHPANFCVVLTADGQGYPKSLYFAVRYNRKLRIESALTKAIKDALDDEFGAGKCSEYSIWYRPEEKRYLSWGSQQSMVMLYRKSEVVTRCAANLEKLANILQVVLASQASSATAEGSQAMNSWEA